MSFISITFALFVTCVLAVYYIIPKKIRWVVLLIASYVFYTWTGFDNLAYILITTVSAYVCAMLIEKRSTEQKKYLSGNKETLTKGAKKEHFDNSLGYLEPIGFDAYGNRIFWSELLNSRAIFR